MFVFQRVGILYTKDVLYIFRSFEYLLAGLAFGLFDAGQRRGVDRDSGDGYGCRVRSIPTGYNLFASFFSGGVDRQKEIDGVEQPCLPVGGSRHASQFVSEFFVPMIF